MQEVKMKRFLTVVIILITIACKGQDFSVTDSMTQTINADNIKHLIIECYCNKGVDVIETQIKTIEIDIKGRLLSVGYHGEQEAPKEIGQEILSFKTKIQNDTLYVISKEWAYIHHFYVIDNLKIQIPKGMNYEIIKISGAELEGREIK